MSNKPLFSIIIPTLNEEKYLPQLLQCLNQQVYKNFETIVVDAQSQDQTQKAVKLFQKKINNLRLIKSSKRNVSFQKNLGAKKAQGQYLIFIDADTFFDKNVFKKLKYYLKKRKTDLFSVRIKFEGNKYKFLNLAMDFFFFLMDKLKRNFGPGCFLGVKKQVFKTIQGFDKRLAICEDNDLVKRLKKSGFCSYRLKQITITTSARRLEKEGLIKFLLKYLYVVIHEHTKGPLYFSSFDYPMGGEY